MPILLYAVETCPLLARQIQSIEFTLTRILMKLFRTGSLNTVNECQLNFGFLLAKYQIFIRTAKFRRKFIASENSLCTLFVSDARQQLHGIFMQFGQKIIKLHVSCAMPFIANFLVLMCDVLLLYIVHSLLLS